MSEEGDVKTIFTVYSYRWFILAMFCSLEMSNALFWVTFSPISDIAQHYFSPSSYYSSTTAVNMLANIFLITYLPGTILGVLMMKHFKLKKAFVLAGSLTVAGGLLRYIATLSSDSLGVSGTYWLIFLGQFCAAMAQPTFLNMPPAVAAAWFPVSERDVATTVGSMCSPVGNAIGQILPILFVAEHAEDDLTDDNYSVKGMENLMLCELLLAVLPLLATVMYFKDTPPTPPSQSTKLKMQSAQDNARSSRPAEDEDANSDDALDPAAQTRDRFSHSLSQKLAPGPSAPQDVQGGGDSMLQR
ncbi:MFS transporter, partial [archaeon]